MKRVIGFFGGDHQVGTTMITQAFAELLANRGRKVLLILGSGKYGDVPASTESVHSLDDLKASIRSGTVEREELLQVLEKKKDMWILPGVRNPFLAKYYPENTFQTLLETAQDDFDYVVIDGGCDYQLGITISALTVSDCRFYITNQQAKVLSRYGFYRKQVLLPLNLSGHLLVNQYTKDPALFLKADILRLCEVSDAVTIPYVEYGWQAEMEGTTLLPYRTFYKAIDKLVCLIEPGVKKEKKWKKNLI